MKLEEYRPPAKLRLAALWASTMFCYIYGDYFGLFVAGALKQMGDGIMGPLGPATPAILTAVSIMMAVPSVMIILSLLLPAIASRWSNILLGLVYRDHGGQPPRIGAILYRARCYRDGADRYDRGHRLALAARQQRSSDVMSSEALFRFPEAQERDPAVDSWFARGDALRGLVEPWFDRLRAFAGVRELIHDGRPTACAEDAAFAYVDAHAVHANIGFFFGASLDDPAKLLEGAGKHMRHVKLRPSRMPDAVALSDLIAAAHQDICRRLDTARP